MRVCVVVGNPKAGSRTRWIGTSVGRGLMSAQNGDTLEVVDLADVAGELFAWPSEVVECLLEQVAGCDLLVVASPTYKAAYTGLLKSFFDRAPSDLLRGLCAIAVMTGGSPDHSLVPELVLRPLLSELGASLPSASLYFNMECWESAEEVIREWVSWNRRAISAALRDA